MLITFPRYYFRYTTKSSIFNHAVWKKAYPNSNKPILIDYIISKSAIDLIRTGHSIIEHASYTKNNQTRVKPQNVLFIHRPHYRADVHKLMCDLPWNLDLRTINLDDYPEYFI